jgi:hypothetical protein
MFRIIDQGLIFSHIKDPTNASFTYSTAAAIHPSPNSPRTPPNQPPSVGRLTPPYHALPSRSPTASLPKQTVSHVPSWPCALGLESLSTSGSASVAGTGHVRVRGATSALGTSPAAWHICYCRDQATGSRGVGLPLSHFHFRAMRPHRTKCEGTGCVCNSALWSCWELRFSAPFKLVWDSHTCLSPVGLKIIYSPLPCKVRTHK